MTFKRFLKGGRRWRLRHHLPTFPTPPNRLDQCLGRRLGIALYLVIADGCGAYEFGQSTTPFEGGGWGVLGLGFACWRWWLCLLKVVVVLRYFFGIFTPKIGGGGRWTNPFWRIIYFSKWVVESTKQLGFFGCFWGFGMGGTGVLNDNCFIFPQKTTSKRR